MGRCLLVTGILVPPFPPPQPERETSAASAPEEELRDERSVLETNVSPSGFPSGFVSESAS